jgi:hypothetical protein
MIVTPSAGKLKLSGLETVRSPRDWSHVNAPPPASVGIGGE